MELVKPYITAESHPDFSEADRAYINRHTWLGFNATLEELRVEKDRLEQIYAGPDCPERDTASFELTVVNAQLWKHAHERERNGDELLADIIGHIEQL